MKKHHYLYQITNKLNGKIYIGARSTDTLPELDPYFGSGAILKKAIKKYGRNSFTKSIIQTFESLPELYVAERNMVSAEFVMRRDTYNIEIGGRGGKIWTDALRNKMSDIQKLRYENGTIVWNKNKKGCFSESTLKKMSDSLKGRFAGDKNPMFGKNVKDYMDEEAFMNMCHKKSIANTGKVRNEAQRKNYSVYAKNRIWLVNKSGVRVHGTIDDPRLNTNEWQRGTKWKQNKVSRTPGCSS